MKPTVAYFRFDLDKTYLATPFESKLKLLRVPFERPESKATLPGMAALVRALREHKGVATADVHVTILSASPTFMAETISAKLRLDGVHVDRLVFKDQWALVKSGRFREVGNPLAYKLLSLIRLGQSVAPGDQEILVGDDWDLDPVIYGLYAEMRAGQIPQRIWERVALRNPLPDQIATELEEFRRRLSGVPTVERVFIRRERKRGPHYYSAFGNRIHVYDDAFQLALLLYDAHQLVEAGVLAVIADLRASGWRNVRFAYSWHSLTEEHRLERREEMMDLLVNADVLTTADVSARTRPPPALGAPDWETILSFRPEDFVE
jgi:beta-phosphoglucomutase-like phosphatase (HAD superfamily)